MGFAFKRFFTREFAPAEEQNRDEVQIDRRHTTADPTFIIANQNRDDAVRQRREIDGNRSSLTQSSTELYQSCLSPSNPVFGLNPTEVRALESSNMPSRPTSSSDTASEPRGMNNASTPRDIDIDIDVDEPIESSNSTDNARFSWMSVLGPSLQDPKDGNPEDDPTVMDEEIPAGTAIETVNPGAMGVVMQGWLQKCGQRVKTWYWRYFVLRDDGVLSYFVDAELTKLKGSMNVGLDARATISIQNDTMDRKNLFMIGTWQRKTMVQAPTLEARDEWIKKLQQVGVAPAAPWDPLRKTVKFYVQDLDVPHEWRRYDDPTSYIHMEGCLRKRGHVNKSWKTRFFRVEKGELRYYTPDAKELKGSMPLKESVVTPGMAQTADGRKNYFVVTSKDGKFEMHLTAFSEDDMRRWIEALQEAQTALGWSSTQKTVPGLHLVVRQAEELPLARISVVYQKPEEIRLTLERRTEALVVTSSREPEGKSLTGIVPGSQVISIAGQSILRMPCMDARALLKGAEFPLQLEFLLPPYKKGVLVKKSRSGLENWKRRVVVIEHGQIHYYKEAGQDKLKHLKSFSLYGCYVNLLEVPNRDQCIVVARSPTDKLVLQASSQEERLEWASVLYCTIRMVSQGVTSGHIEQLQLERRRSRLGS